MSAGLATSWVPRRKARLRCRFVLPSDADPSDSEASVGDTSVLDASGPDSSVSAPSASAGGSVVLEPTKARASSRTTVTMRATSRAGSR